MSQVLLVEADNGKNWAQEIWELAQDGQSPATHVSEMLIEPDIFEKYPQTTTRQLSSSVVSTTEDTVAHTEPNSSQFLQRSLRRGNVHRSASKKASSTVPELVNPLLVELPKALVSQDTTGVKSKSSSSLSSLARRGSWLIRSRSPISGHRRTPSTHVSKPEKAVVGKVDANFLKPDLDDIDTTKVMSRISTSTKSLSVGAIFSRSASSPQISTITEQTKSKKGSPTTIVQSCVPEMPSSITSSRMQQLQNARVERIKKKDELWNAFKVLDQEYTKFCNKPISFKASVLRLALLPFLQQYANHASNKALRVEDLDRRVNILNKWWTGLLEMLNSRNGSGLISSDRPAVLDSLTGIMQRPEWRYTTATLFSSSHNTTESSSSLSFMTSNSDIVVETVLSNTRNIFSGNLLSQVKFAVERMSLRTVAATVVAFCGRSIAYAFFYCPGIADILIKLWSPQQTILRRVLDEFGILRNTNLKSTTECVTDSFPKHLNHLCMTSLPVLLRTLRAKSALSSDLEKINWNGPWLGRWSGRDSDLFFSFMKHHHNLICEMLGQDSTDQQRLCAPGTVLVYGQMLTIMDATIQVHRNSNVLSQGVTFDDVLGVDASAAAMSIKGVNAARPVAENRLIVLLREVLSDSCVTFPGVKISFAALFGNLLKAVTKRTCVNDGDACFMLCDFLEESMNILARFFRNTEDPMAFLDWPFWFDVLKRLGSSNNTMTEVRLHAFIYSLWGYITKDEAKKRDLCMNWLLSDEYAYHQFNHWCPMVRAYYQRLLIWRVARCYGTPSVLDIEIYSTVLSLLQKIFNQYLHKLSTAEQQKLPKPCSVPASPAPGRRLLIIRDDSILAPTVTLPTFLASSTDHATHDTLSSLETLNNLASPDLTGKVVKKRFTFLRGLNPFGAAGVSSTPDSSSSVSPQHSPPSSTHTPGDSTGVSTPESQCSRPGTPATPLPDFIPSRSFKFSLEWIERPLSHNKNKRLFPPRLPPSSQALVPRELADAILVGTEHLAKSEEGASRYIGIALAEWSILVVECAAFAERRRYEGVPYGREETPVLGTETFRKPVG